MPTHQRDRRRRRTLAAAWEQAEAERRSIWSKIRWNERTDLGRRLELLGTQLRGVSAKAALALVRLQGRWFGAVIVSGEKLARNAGISESAWWHWARPELEVLGFIRTVERGGGRMKGGDGCANVYMSPDAGKEPAPPRERPRSPAPPTAREQAAAEPAGAGATSPSPSRGEGPVDAGRAPPGRS